MHNSVSLKLYKKNFVIFSQGAILIGIAEKTGGQEFYASDDFGDESFATLASQTSTGGCDTESDSKPVYPIRLT